MSKKAELLNELNRLLVHNVTDLDMIPNTVELYRQSTNSDCVAFLVSELTINRGVIVTRVTPNFDRVTGLKTTDVVGKNIGEIAGTVGEVSDDMWKSLEGNKPLVKSWTNGRFNCVGIIWKEDYNTINEIIIRL